MALGDGYITSAQLKGYIGQSPSDTTDDTRISDAINSASRSIEKFCHRQFNAAGVVSARVYYPDGYCLTAVDDFSTTSGLVVKTDEDGDGTYETTWTLNTDVQLEPLNGVVDGETGWPFWQLRTVGAKRFPCVLADSIAPLQVTANWGWTAVPASVKQACLILASNYFRLAGAPFGVAGYDQFGPIRVKAMPQVMELLNPYVLSPVLVG